MNSAISPNGHASKPLLAVRGLVVEYRARRRAPAICAVDGVDLTIAPHETVGLVGESGSGKSSLGRAILGLAPIKHGSVEFAGKDITHASYQERRALSSELQVIFQDPYSSLNPVRTIGQTLAEPLRVHERLPRPEVNARVRAMLERVGLPAEAADRFPGQFSGGQRQRIAIARALMINPRLVICDEPVSALDLSIQAQVLNLLRQLQEDLELSYLFIAHDLAVVRHIAHRILVLYRGRIMEEGTATAVNDAPAHPYTRALLQAAPVPDPERQRARSGVPPGQGSQSQRATDANSCPFEPRCPYAIDTCRSARPTLERTPDGSLVACHRWRELRREPAAVLAGRG